MGRAAVAVIRVSGPDAWSVAHRVFPSLPEAPVPRHAYYGDFEHGDDGICLLFAGGASYTGEPSAEFSIHGSPASVQGLVEACMAAGCRQARPGEFTMRAFLNGRLDLAQAEAVRDVIEAQTVVQLKFAQHGLHRALSEAVQTMEDSVLRVLAAVEASVDFEEEIGAFDRAEGVTAITNACDQLDDLIESAESGEVLRQGLRVALIGRPNVGKSSLLNALAGSCRAIVTDIPGTTRDVLEVALDIHGKPVILWDTAGQRESDDLVESEGIRRATDAAHQADLILLLYDAGEGWLDSDQQLLDKFKGRKLEIIGNKSDLQEPARGLRVSAKTGNGMDGIKRLLAGQFDGLEGQILPNPRQTQELLHAAEHLQQVRTHMNEPVPDDLLAVGLRAALVHLGRISGKTADSSMLESIFSQFCIGK